MRINGDLNQTKRKTLICHFHYLFCQSLEKEGFKDVNAMSNAFKRFLLFDELSLFKWFRLCQNFSTLAQIRKQESGVFFLNG